MGRITATPDATELLSIPRIELNECSKICAAFRGCPHDFVSTNAMLGDSYSWFRGIGVGTNVFRASISGFRGVR